MLDEGRTSYWAPDVLRGMDIREAEPTILAAGSPKLKKGSPKIKKGSPKPKKGSPKPRKGSPKA